MKTFMQIHKEMDTIRDQKHVLAGVIRQLDYKLTTLSYDMCRASGLIRKTSADKGLDVLGNVLSEMKEVQKELDQKQREYDSLSREFNKLFKEGMSLI